MGPETDPTFVRRKFTNTEQLDEQLEEMAQNHYQGNVSLCLRQSITDHRETLNGQGRLTLQRLSQRVNQVNENVTSLAESIESMAEYFEAHHTRHTEMNADHLAVGTKQPPDARQVLEAIQEAESPLRAEDVIERVAQKPIVVRRALGFLIDHGHVMTTIDDPPRYRLAQMTADTDQH